MRAGETNVTQYHTISHGFYLQRPFRLMSVEAKIKELPTSPDNYNYLGNKAKSAAEIRFFSLIAKVLNRTEDLTSLSIPNPAFC